MKFLQLIGGVVVALVFAAGAAWVIMNTRFFSEPEPPKVDHPPPEKKGKEQ